MVEPLGAAISSSAEVAYVRRSVFFKEFKKKTLFGVGCIIHCEGFCVFIFYFVCKHYSRVCNSLYLDSVSVMVVGLDFLACDSCAAG